MGVPKAARPAAARARIRLLAKSFNDEARETLTTGTQPTTAEDRSTPATPATASRGHETGKSAARGMTSSRSNYSQRDGHSNNINAVGKFNNSGSYGVADINSLRMKESDHHASENHEERSFGVVPELPLLSLSLPSALPFFNPIGSLNRSKQKGADTAAKEPVLLSDRLGVDPSLLPPVELSFVKGNAQDCSSLLMHFLFIIYLHIFYVYLSPVSAIFEIIVTSAIKKQMLL